VPAQCVRRAELRVLIPLLPPEAYGIASRRAEGLYAEALAAGGDAWDEDESLPLGQQAMRAYGRTSYEKLEQVQPSRRISIRDLRAALMRGRRSGGKAPVHGARLQDMLDAAQGRMAVLAQQTADKAVALTSLSQRDLERIVIAKFERIGRVMNMSLVSEAELRHADIIFVPYPLISMRSSTAVSAAFQAMMRAHVPTLFRNKYTKKHVFVWGRLFQDTLMLPSFARTVRPLVQQWPFTSATYITTQAFMDQRLSRSQVTVPYPGIVRVLRRDTPIAESSGSAVVAAGAKKDVQTWLPTLSREPRLGSCDPLCTKNGTGCSAAAEAKAIFAVRPLLASFLGETRDGVPERVSAIRQLLACPECAVFDMSAPIFQGAYSMSLVYSLSVFCVQPHGDAPPRKATFDALLLGCIPVLLDHSDPATTLRAPRLPFRKHLPWRKFAVLLTGKEWKSGLVKALRAIPPRTIREMQRRLAQVAPLLQYSWTPEDARAAIGGHVTRLWSRHKTIPVLRGKREGIVNATMAPKKVEVANALTNASGQMNATACAQDAFDMLLLELLAEKRTRK
jgi:hypothetical protein